MRKILLALLLIQSLLSVRKSSAQSIYSKVQMDAANKLYVLADSAFKYKNYLLADSFATAGIRMVPHADAFYFRAGIKKFLEKTEAYCIDLRTAKSLGNKNALDLYFNDCEKRFHGYLDKNGQSIEEGKHKYEIEIRRRKFDKSVCHLKWVMSDTKFLTECFIVNKIGDTSWVFCADTAKCGNAKRMEARKEVEICNSAKYPGGDFKLKDDLGFNIQYPEGSLLKRIQGTIYTRFVVDEQGYVSEVEAINDELTELAVEASRVVMQLSRFTIETKNNISCKTLYILPIKFTLK